MRHATRAKGRHKVEAKGRHKVEVSHARPLASVSLDADNLWSYLRTHGDSGWTDRPSYLSALISQMETIFADHAVSPSVFVVGADATRPDGAEFVARTVSNGWEVGNHSFEHEPWLHLYSAKRLRDEIERTEEALMAAGAPKPLGFRAPGYSMSPDLIRALVELGYKYDASVLPTWIGPAARLYYLRTNRTLSAEERGRRKALFGTVHDALLPNAPFTWEIPDHDGNGLNATLRELPVTVFPGVRIPIHASYVIYLHTYSPAAAKAYVRAALTACRMTGRGPSVLLHPLDLLDAKDAPGLEFFPGMKIASKTKRSVVDSILSQLNRYFSVVDTGTHARNAALGRTQHADLLGRGRSVSSLENPLSADS